MGDDLDSQMRTVLAQLALTSNGTTAKMDADRGGGSARFYDDVILAGSLRFGDLPHKRFERLYNEASTPAEREAVLEQARERLGEITRSRPRSTVSQTLEDLYAWIVAQCEGLPRHEAARRACTGATTVHKARLAAGREPDYGRARDRIRYTSAAERRGRVRELAEQDMSAASIAHHLGLAYSTVLRDLGRKR